MKKTSTHKKRDILSVSISIFKSAKRAAQLNDSDTVASSESLEKEFKNIRVSREKSTSTIEEFPITDPTEDTLESIQKKAQVAHQQICAALELYNTKEKEVRTSLKYHLDRAKARLEYNNATGSLLSMRKYKKLEFEYSRLNDAIQNLSMNNLAMIRFNRKIKVALQDPSGGASMNSLSLQCDLMCDALLETQRIVKQDDRGCNQIDQVSDADMMAELERLVFKQPEVSGEYFFDADEENFFDAVQASFKQDGDNDSDCSESSDDEITFMEDDTDVELEAADEELLDELVNDFGLWKNVKSAWSKAFTSMNIFSKVKWQVGMRPQVILAIAGIFSGKCCFFFFFECCWSDKLQTIL